MANGSTTSFRGSGSNYGGSNPGFGAPLITYDGGGGTNGKLPNKANGKFEPATVAHEQQQRYSNGSGKFGTIGGHSRYSNGKPLTPPAANGKFGGSSGKFATLNGHGAYGKHVQFGRVDAQSAASECSSTEYAPRNDYKSDFRSSYDFTSGYGPNNDYGPKSDYNGSDYSKTKRQYGSKSNFEKDYNASKSDYRNGSKVDHGRSTNDRRKVKSSKKGKTKVPKNPTELWLV